MAHRIALCFILLGGVGCAGDSPTTPEDGARSPAWTIELMSGGSAAVWGSSPDNLFVGSALGYVLRWNGENWEPTATGSGAGVRALWGASPTDVFGVDTDGTIHRFDGRRWSVSGRTPAGESLS